MELSTVREESDKLHRKLPNKLDAPDYQELREKYLKSLPLGKQAPEYKKADKHIRKFINLFEFQD